MANCSNHLDEDIFGVGLTAPEEIPIDDELEAQKYALRVYDKLRRRETQLTDELLESQLKENINKSQSISLTSSEESVDQLHVIEADSYISINFDGQIQSVPKFNDPKKVKEWRVQIEKHQRRLCDIMKTYEQVTAKKDLSEEIAKLAASIEKACDPKIKDKHQADLIRKTMFIALAEDKIVKRLGEVAFTLKDLECTIDSATSGIWIQPPSDSEAEALINHLGTSRVILASRYRFDANTTENLIRVMFSSKPDVRAQAKLNLNAKLENSIFQEVILKPEKVLELVCAEAQLTQEEILFTVFPKAQRTDDRLCLACGTSILLGDAVYHSYCSVTKWLSTYCRFDYDHGDQCMTPSAKMYLTPTQRKRLTDLLKLNAKYNSDIVQKTESKTAIWRRQPDGSLKEINVRSQRPAEIVGTYAWRKAHGLISETKH